MDDYYKRNFSDYFSASSDVLAKEGSENQERIKAWLQKNAEPALPVRPAGTTFPAK